MILHSSKRLQGAIVIRLILGLTGGTFAATAQDPKSVTEISPNVLVFATSTGNVIASVGPDGALLVGMPSAGSTAQICDVLKSRTKSAVRYIVVAPQGLAQAEGDGGWGRLGAFVAMQENALERLGGHAMGAPRPLPPRLTELGVGRPAIAFSEVLTFDLNGEAIHVVHQPPGYSDADAIVHFHVANLVYLGNVFPGDGYPEIDPQQRGNLDGWAKTLEAWSGNGIGVVPARGKAMTGRDVNAYRDMIVAVRDRIKRMIDDGKTEQQVIVAHPTADFDARWGSGRVGSDAFVHGVYNALKAH
jgi:cyclase